MQYGNRAHYGGGPYAGTSYTPARPDGCHPVDGCQDGTPFYGSVFQYLAANVIDTRHATTRSCRRTRSSTPRRARRSRSSARRFEGTPLVVTPTGVAGLDFLDEADTVNALVPRLKQKGVEAIVLLLHQGGFQNAPFSRGFMDVNACENFTGRRPARRRQPARRPRSTWSSARTRTRRTSARINGRLVTEAASFGRLITSIDLTIDRKHQRLRLGDGEEQHRHADGGQGRGRDRAPRALQGALRSDREPRHRHGSRPTSTRRATPPSGTNRRRRAADGQRDRGRAARGRRRRATSAARSLPS